MPPIDQLKLEYRIEVLYKGLKNIPGLETWEEFYSRVKRGKKVSLTKSMDREIHYRSRTQNKRQLLSLIRSYASYPEFRNEGTVQNLYDRIENGQPMHMPLILRWPDGTQRILSGNTRLDIAFQLGKTPTVLIINVGA